jgi:hypothetical protein
MSIYDDDHPTRAECERDEEHRKPSPVTQEKLDRWRRDDPWNPENQRRD